MPAFPPELETAMSDLDRSEKTMGQVDERTLQLLVNALRDLHYGQVTVIVQDASILHFLLAFYFFAD